MSWRAEANKKKGIRGDIDRAVVKIMIMMRCRVDVDDEMTQ